ncbi:hypothetical protein PFISCL1PPCAC_17926, partial [Pristionchus fissidentatus]
FEHATKTSDEVSISRADNITCIMVSSMDMPINHVPINSILFSKIPNTARMRDAIVTSQQQIRTAEHLHNSTHMPHPKSF